MSLYGSLFSSVSGLGAQGSALAMISDNVANLNTIGYKGSEATFQTLVTDSGSNSAYSPGGVRAISRQTIDQQGLLKSTGKTTDLAISGSGFFVVNNSDNIAEGNYLYTRAGSFEKDARGNFKNSAGYNLLAWPLDSEGRLPGAPGNINTASSALLDSLEIVNIKTVSGTASQTTKVEAGINLKSSESILQGSGETILFPNTSANYQAASDTVIIPDATAGVEFADGDSITLTPSNPGTAYTFTYGGVEQSDDISGGILGATSATTPFLTTAGATSGDNFTITNATSGTVTFTFIPGSPTVSRGEFNSLNTLADAINRTSGLAARVEGNYLYIAASDADEAITFADVTGTFAADLGLANVAAAGAGVRRFATLQDLANKINASDVEGVSANLKNPLDSSSIEFYADDPLGSLIINATANAAPSDQASIFDQLGLPSTTIPLIKSSAYSASDTTKNIASGEVTPHFSRNVRIFDAFGTGHDFRVSFVKIDKNVWSTEIYSLNPSEIVTTRTDGQIAAGNIEFNGDGTLRNVDSALSVPIEIVWENKAIPSSISFNWGTAGQVAGTAGATQIGLTDGLSQLDSDYNVKYMDQNGIAPGLLNSVEIDSNGFIIAKFSNGTSRKLYKIPLAEFTSPNNLQGLEGNVYTETNESGSFNLKEPAKGGIGTITPGALEQANVELSNELTSMIVAQRGYQANTRVVKTANEMLEELARVM